jgi:hypothetical protein
VKARHSYPLLFFIPSAVLGAVAGVLAGAAGGGILWLFVYGDSPWPAQANAVVMAMACVVAVAVLGALLLAAYRAGNVQDARGGLRKAHVLMALGLSVGLPLLLLLHQWLIGNIGHSTVVSDAAAAPPAPFPGAE